MFEGARSIRFSPGEEIVIDILIIRQTAEDSALHTRYLCQNRSEPLGLLFRVEPCWSSNQVVRSAFDFESRQIEIAHLSWRIYKSIVIGRGEGQRIGSLFESRDDLPAL